MLKVWTGNRNAPARLHTSVRVYTVQILKFMLLQREQEVFHVFLPSHRSSMN
jgi:hypothetical protein